ncbi:MULTISPECIES: glycosyltransferase family 2 protein [unclassified Gemella]|uniref:glycosyltransferase family 2 protein n=1 Tax=unclassified Gemella TaxID=2624949 RepID=UPI0010734AC4|nr:MULTISPECIES: glycosyltransferase family 2 protein [unclassified Gemella]MBF0709868.1 glycosyltransferase family 2 protein [Gemella sp. GL1.1]MBF0746828.1 glycosyltransferase family 2 protein [Gemella sp. 19428wG2_WT2a]NYS27212.1 glycosyltransferase family 2 protein [Gemella sp. GL1]TFU59553.1 glycosyltransferase family 2 protein [Gemella sp. WT2a]
MDLISVIVPVYKVEDYLEKSVNSIINQTYKNLEIILVDDGSPDRSGQICDQLAKKDDRIVVYHKENGGVSAARNFALEKARGAYISFVDSDDYLELNMLEELYNIAIKEDADFVESNFNLILRSKKRKYTEENYYLRLDKKEYLKEYLLMDKLFGASWGKIIKADLAKSILFPIDQPIYEDMEYQYQLIKKSNKIILTSQQYYNYVVRKDSETNSDFKEKNMYLLDILNEIKDYTLSNYPDLENEVRSREMYAYFGIFNQIIMLDNYKENKYYYQVKNYLKKNLIYILKNPCIKRNRKISTLLLVVSTRLYKVVLKTYGRLN